MEIMFGLVGLLLASVLVVAVGDRVGLPWPALLTLVITAAVFIPGIPTIEIPADLILPIFLPPLLWALARRMTWGVLRYQLRTIIVMSIVLVVLTTAAVGAAAYALLPGVGVAAAVLIGAAIAPPDPVAVDAVSEPAGIPRRIVTSLQVEGLFNDAASIVAFHLALYAITTDDEISLGRGVVDFVYSAGVACIVGYVIGRLAALFFAYVSDSTARNALTWVVPFATYISAEEFGASGVIAVVLAAIELHSRAPIEAEDRLSGQSFWETVELLFTGVAFGLIGTSVRDAIDTVGGDLWHSVMVGVVLSVVAIAVRCGWLYVFYRFNRRAGRRRIAPLRLQEVLLMTWSGMRGLVTLALVLSVPAAAVAFHHELTVIALTVLLVTMVLPGLALPWLMSRLDLTDNAEALADKMRAEITERSRKAAIEALRARHDPAVATAIDDWFETNLGADGLGEGRAERVAKLKKARRAAENARAIAFRASQQELLRMRHEGRYHPAIVDEVLAEVDRMVLATTCEEPAS